MCPYRAVVDKLMLVSQHLLVRVKGPSSRQVLFFICIVNIYVVHPYSRIDTTDAWKKLRFILSYRWDFHMIDNLSIAVNAFASRILMLFSIDETLLLGYVNLSADFREPPFKVEMSPSWLKHKYSILSPFTWRPIPPVACSRLCSRDSA